MAAPRIVALAAIGLVVAACASENGEHLGTTSESLTAYCDANVKGKGSIPTETDYLPHVVDCENGGAPTEALKAQAVVARTYLYYKLDASGSVADGQGDQVYSCSSTPTAAHEQAVKDTSGLVLQYKNATICSFFVAGGKSQPPGCMGGSDPTGTEQYVTYNAGKSGANIDQSTIGYVSPTNSANRGCMSQNGSSCLANEGKTFVDILKFYYGDDIELVTASGPCVVSTDVPDAGDGGGGGGGSGGGGGGGGGNPSGSDSGSIGGNAGEGTPGNLQSGTGGCAVAPRGSSSTGAPWAAGMLVALAALAIGRRRGRDD